jgi:hypothetical protein
LLRDVREATAAVVQVERVSAAAHEEQVDVAVAIDVRRRDTAAREGRRCLEQTVPELSQPTGRTVREVDAGCGGDIGEEAPAVGLRRRARGRHDHTRGRLGGARSLVAQGAVGGDRGRRREVVRVEADGLDTLFGDLAGQAEQEHAVLRDGLGEDLRRNRVRQALGVGGRAGGVQQGAPVEPEVSQRVAVESLEGDAGVCGQIGEDVHVLELVDPLRDEALGGALRVRGSDQAVSRSARALVGDLQELAGEGIQSAPEGRDEGPAVRSVARERLPGVEAIDIEDEELVRLFPVDVVVALVGRELPSRDALEERERLRAHERGVGRSRAGRMSVASGSVFRHWRDARPRRDQALLRNLELVSGPRIAIREL